MAKKFSELDAASPLDGSELVAVSQFSGSEYHSRKATVDEIAARATKPSADQVPYDNSTSGLTAIDVQDAIDELAASRAKNHSDTRDPVATDDSSEGYSGVSADSPGSRWFNSTTGEVFACMDATAGAAVWVKTSLTLDELGSAALANVGTGASEVPTNGDLGSAALANVGMGASEVPTNGDLGSAALANVGTGASEVPTNGDLGSAAYVSLAALPFPNILEDGGRFGELPEAFSLSLPGPFSVRTSFFGPYNGSSLSEAGKFIHNNTSHGGSSGTLAPTVNDLLARMGRTGVSARYGVEFYIASLDFGAGTVRGASFSGETLYLGCVSGQAFFASAGTATFCGWVRAVGGNVGVYSEVDLDGVRLPRATITPADGWVFIRVAPVRAIGYDAEFPYFFGASGRSLQIACPAVFPGYVDTGMHTAPIPNVGVL